MNEYNSFKIEKLCTFLKRYSFDSKMQKAYESSVTLLDKRICSPDFLSGKALPYLIEAFVMLSVKMDEWNSKILAPKDYQKCIDSLFVYIPELFEGDSSHFAERFMITTAANQFDSQVDPLLRLSRYCFYFSYVDNSINMLEQFVNKFEVSYIKIATPIVYIFKRLHKNWDNNEMSESEYRELQQMYPKAFELLTLSRVNYIRELDKITADYHYYVNCLRPSYSYPFISYNNKIYNPTPHLLLKSITTSLMFRLTDGNNKLRDEIGKNVIETYLFKVVECSGVFNEVLPEQKYGNCQRTLDVMASDGRNIVCFDSKFYSPKIGVRILDSNDIDHDKQRLVSSIVQVYKHINNRFGNEYSFLNTTIKDDRSNIYGIVVVSENSYIRLETLYKKAAAELEIQIPSMQYDWLRGHVGLVDIDILEKALYYSVDFIELVQKNEKSGNYDDNWFMTYKRKPGINYPMFVKENISSLLASVTAVKLTDMNENGKQE